MVGETDGIAVGPEVVGDVKVTEWSPRWYAVLMAMWSGPMVGSVEGKPARKVNPIFGDRFDLRADDR